MTGGTSDLESTFDRERTFLGRHRDGSSVLVQKLQSPAMPLIGFVPRNLDEHSQSRGPDLRTNEVPPTTGDVQLPLGYLSEIRQQ